ncbi:MAG: VOC family protein, partial [Chloroflexi bacterium]|nr:VOC family protein [Chloroflexota bacterium]
MGHPSIQQQITFFYTSDLARTAAFYEDVLGLPVS